MNLYFLTIIIFYCVRRVTLITFVEFSGTACPEAKPTSRQ